MINKIFNYQFSIFNKTACLPGTKTSCEREGGQSLFEVVFALAIVALILVGVVSLAAKAIANSNFSRNNALATKYAQEGVEWLREQRDTDWATFRGNATGTRCLGSSPPTWGGGGLCTIAANTNFRRGATFTTVSVDEINAVVIVEWTDGQGAHQVRSATTFTNWDE